MAEFQYRFEVAFSFAGPHRDKVRAIAQIVRAAIDADIAKYNQGRVFFDEWFEHELLGSDMDVLLQRIYHKQSRMVVADLSEEYADRKWPQSESRAIRSLRMELDTARDETERLRLLNIRFGEGDVPGVLDTDGWLDGQRSAEVCAELILRRHALLVERTTEPPHSTERHADEKPKIGITSSQSGPTSPKPNCNWVWHSSLSTRAAGQVSVLACLETICAVLLYWWIACRYDTHWHLVSSVFIAPLLLLRSPDSVESGIRWFRKDWFGVDPYKNWSRLRRLFWFVIIVISTGVPSYFLAVQLAHYGLDDIQGWALIGRAAACGAVLASAGMIVWYAALYFLTYPDANAESGTSSVEFAAPFLDAMRLTLVVSPLVAVVEARGLGATVGVVVGMIAAVFVPICMMMLLISVNDALGSTVIGVFYGLITGIASGIGLAGRALLIRVAATFSHLVEGIWRLPSNWKENNLLTDSMLPAELLPGIRDHDQDLTFDGMVRGLSKEPGFFDMRDIERAFDLMSACFYFFPAFLYRLNIKATAWFWWPLAYLLEPPRLSDVQGQQKQALCWPWTNPFQRMLILLSILLMLVSVVLHNTDMGSSEAWGKLQELPLPLKVSLAIGWINLGPWHWAQWTIAGTGILMLAIAGNAHSHNVNGNWYEYRWRWSRHIHVMTYLQRLRALSTLALLIMAFGGLLLQYPSWLWFGPVPEYWRATLDRVYGTMR